MLALEPKRDVVDMQAPRRRSLEERIRELREEVHFLVDEVLDREAQLEHPPEPECPGCHQPFRKHEHE